MKRLPLLLILLSLFLTPSLALGDEGECIEGDCVNGQGTETYPDGSTYVGEFKDGKKYGQGTMTFPDGSKYVGEFKDGLPNGQGTLTSPDGSKYVGE